MFCKVFTEVLERALERLNGAWRKSAVSITGTEQPALLRQQIDVAGLSPSGLDRIKNLLYPREAFATWCAPAAGFPSEKDFKVMDKPDRARLVVEHDHGAGAHAAAGFHDRVEVHLDIQMFFN
jgi:hypothetical protein